MGNTRHDRMKVFDERQHLIDLFIWLEATRKEIESLTGKSAIIVDFKILHS